MSHWPVSTYRLQYTPDFTFSRATDVVTYLKDLGIGAIYASPIFSSRSGSQHGYDVVDPETVDTELGGARELEDLLKQTRSNGLGWVQDIVPNHMALDSRNRWLMDILENGPESEYRNFFDIEWEHSLEALRGKLLLPILGGFFGDVLERGEIRLLFDQEGLGISYFDWRFPLNLDSYPLVLENKVSWLQKKLGEDHPDANAYLGILFVLKTLPSRDTNGEREQGVRFVKRMLREVAQRNPLVRRLIEENVERFNGKPGIPDSFNRLEELLKKQHFRLSFWKVVTDELNYRRFFTINELISLQANQPKVFEKTHSLLKDLVSRGLVNGVRVDHIDGLYDPAGYLKDLREAVGEIPCYVEKILDREEDLPEDWPVEGTTGYDFLDAVNGLFCSQENRHRLLRCYTRFTGQRETYRDLVYQKKKLILDKHMAGDLDNLSRSLKDYAGQSRYGYDITFRSLRSALAEAILFFPVYRSYISQTDFSERDWVFWQEAMARGKEQNPDLMNEFHFLERILAETIKPSDAESSPVRRHVLMRLQQLCAPLVAKGVEDTLFYVFCPLVNLNEVGGHPDRFGFSLGEFHRLNWKRCDTWPATLNTTSTHDTKRGEDARVRMAVISELATEWEQEVNRWSRLNRKRKKRVSGKAVPDRNDEYFFYQNLLGAYPFDSSPDPPLVERMKQYMLKAVREAKVHTAWIKPDSAYEGAFITFIEHVLDQSSPNPFLEAILPFQQKIAFYGAINSLSQALIKITSPGIPDFYQGTELWDFSLVDPDNRRPVDYESRKRLLKMVHTRCKQNRGAFIEDLLESYPDGVIKLFVITEGLRLRADKRFMFEEGKYLPLEVTGPKANHLVTFARTRFDGSALVVAPRLCASLVQPGQFPLGESVWGETALTLPDELSGEWTEWFTRRKIMVPNQLPVGELLRFFPVALLVR